jgi:putative N6-adenine-specific DNA methylase
LPSREWEVFVSTAPGLEAITSREMERLGLPSTRVETGGLGLRASDEGLQRLNRQLRTASRVLVRLAAFRASSFGELERKAKEIPWERVLPGAPPQGVGRPAFEVTSRKSRLYHTGAIAERLERSLGAWADGRPSVPEMKEVPPPRFVVRILRDRLVLSADASGDPLHRRGYRQAVAKAPLRENVAAALILAAGWDGRSPLFDPFCGSGTLIIEGALIAGRIPPGAGRRFAFERWPDFSLDAQKDRPAPPLTTEKPGPEHPHLLGADRDAGAIRAATANAERAGVAGAVSWVTAPLSRAPFPVLEALRTGAGEDAGGPRGLLVTNPPWGHRVGDNRRLKNLYARLGALLSERWGGGRAALLCPDPALVGQLGFETRTLFRTRLGGIPVEALALDVD